MKNERHREEELLATIVVLKNINKQSNLCSSCFSVYLPAFFSPSVSLSLSLYLTIACKRWMRAGRQAGIRSHFFSSYANKERNYDDENLGTSLFFSVSFSFFYSLLLSLHYCQILTRPQATRPSSLSNHTSSII